MVDSKQIKTYWLDSPMHDFMRETAVALGGFDGIHCGHAHLIERLVAEAEARKLSPVVLTFDPLPRVLFSDDFRILSTSYERELLLRRFALAAVVHVKFTQQLADMRAENFVTEFLTKTLGAKLLVVGDDHHFGKNREGSSAVLQQLCDACGFSTIVLPHFTIDGQDVKSNAVRLAVAAHDMQKARTLLGHPYLVAGKCARGNGFGRKLGFATANLEFAHCKLLPPDGVYAARTCVKPSEVFQDSIVYIGKSPTFAFSQRQFETHILDYPGDELYDKYIVVELLDFIRPKLAFRTIDDLRDQILQDIESANGILAKIPA